MKKNKLLNFVIAALLFSNVCFSQVFYDVDCSSQGTPYFSSAMGMNCDASNDGYGAVASGRNSTASGSYSHAFGYNATATDNSSFAIGYNCTASEASYGFGVDIDASTNSTAIGGRFVTTSGSYSVGIGTDITASNTGSFVIGYGVTSGSRLINNDDYSLMVGFYSTIPTFYVGTSSGVGTIGRVGIGTSTPSETFEVNCDDASGYAGYFFNDGNNVNRYGIKIQCGLDDQTGDTENYYLRGFDGDGTEEGGLKVNLGVFQLYNSSDKRLKTNITDTKLNGLEIINKLRVVDFNWKKNTNSPVNTGFIAQEVKEVYPLMVGKSPEGFFNISQGLLIPVIVQAMQKQQEIINDLQKEVNTLKEIIAQSNTNNNTNKEIENDITGNTNANAMLYENSPNPFNEQTEINYFLADNVNNASLIIFDMSGRQIKSYKLTDKGYSKVVIQANELSPGMFFYSLIANGKEVGTKKMILTE